jgi:L-malate glycosyltransferase
MSIAWWHRFPAPTGRAGRGAGVRARRGLPRCSLCLLPRRGCGAKVIREIRDLLVDVYNVPAAGIQVLPAIPAVPVRPPAPQPGGGRSAVVGFAGRLSPEKGVDVFLHAASIVAGVLPEARFVVIGGGPLRGELEALAGDLGLLEDRVRFLGFRDDAADLIAGLDILAVPSRSEGTPLVVGEAMAAGFRSW